MYSILYLYISAPLYEACCSKCSEKYAAGNESFDDAACVQQSGIDRKGNFCYLGRTGIWVFCSVPLRTGHMGGLLYFCFDLRIFVQEGIEIEA